MTLSELKQRYTTVTIYVRAVSRSCPLGDGSRTVFWVLSDGRHALVYDSTCERMSVATKDFTIMTSPKVMDFNGRLKVLNGKGWKDLGPLATAARVETDPPLGRLSEQRVKRLPAVQKPKKDVVKKRKVNDAKVVQEDPYAFDDYKSLKHDDFFKLL